ncbi:uncharacterized protein LOC111865310 isoform X2 [Cryptotermes secundus]|uniref:uncharacterized protein LOC111865310 isoform X2 n=1 Tax=Cryptotermes secundus TaxID=105785 RepID=UPI001454DD29|nr:uncharacterized protein LOC111865310 isoform X2 [Cryptotermes secundus]
MCDQEHRTAAGRTDVIVIQKAENAVPYEPLKADEHLVLESPDIETPDPSKGLREILAEHHIERYKKNPPSLIISPQLSHISEEKLSQISTGVHASPQYEISTNSGSPAFPPISKVDANFLNSQDDNLKQHSEESDLVKKGNDRYSESVPSVSYCSRGGEGNCESVGQRMDRIASHSASMTPTIHISRIDRIENKIVKHKLLGYGVKSAKFSCIKVGFGLFSSEQQKVDVNMKNSISNTIEQCEIKKTSFNEETKSVDHKPGRIMSSLKENIRPKVMEQNIARKDIGKERFHKTKECNKGSSLIVDSANSTYKFKPSSIIGKSDGAELSENISMINSDSKKGTVVSKTSLQRARKLLQKPQALNGDSSENSAKFKKVEKVTNTEVILCEKSKELLHKPEELAEVSVSASLQSNSEVQKDKNKRMTARSVLESCSVSREMKNMGITKVLLLHRTKDVSDKSPKQTTLSDNGNTTDKSETFLYKYEEKDECQATENAVQNDSDIENIKHTAKSNATFKGKSQKLCNKRIKPSASDTISVRTLEFQKAATGNTSTEKAKNLLHKPLEETEISTLKLDAPNPSSYCEVTRATSSRMTGGATKELCNNEQGEVPVSEDCVENNTTANCGNITKVHLRLRNKQQEEMGNCVVNNRDPLVKSIAIRARKVTKKSQEQIYLLESNVQHDSDFLEDMKISNTRNKVEGKMQLNYRQQEELRDHGVNSDSVPQPTVNKLGPYNQPQEESEALKNNVQNKSNISEHKKKVNSRKGMEKSSGLHKKQEKVLGNCAMIDSDSLIEPTANNSKRKCKSLKKKVLNKLHFTEAKKKTSSKQTTRRSERLNTKQKVEVTNFSVDISDSLAKPTACRPIELGQKPLEEGEASNSADNLHGQCIPSTILSWSPKKLIHEGEEKIRSFNSEMSDVLQNKQQIFINTSVVNRQNSCHMSGGSIVDLMLKNNLSNKQVASTNEALNDGFKETDNMAVGEGKSSELHQRHQMDVTANATTNKLRQVLQKPQMVMCPGIVNEGRMVGNQDSSGFSAVINDGKSHDVEETLGRVHSKIHTSSDNYPEEQHDHMINGKSADVPNILGNDILSSHSAQEHSDSNGRKLGSPSDISCGPKKQKYITTSSKDDCSINSNSISSKMSGKISRSVSKTDSKKNTSKGIQEHSVIRKPNHSSLDLSKLQQLISEWDSDTEGVRSDECLQDEQPPCKNVMPHDVDMITNPPAVILQQHLKEKDINKADDKHEKLLLGEASNTNGKNPDLTVNEELNKHSKSPLISHTISVKLQNVVENTSESRNEELILSENSKAKGALNSSSTQKVHARKAVKSSYQLEHVCSSPKKDNLKQMQGLPITKIVPSPEALTQLSKTQETSNDSIKTPSRKRRLYSVDESHELIEPKDCDDHSGISTPRIPCPSRGAKRRLMLGRKSNVNGTVTKKLQDGKGERKKEEPFSACSERDQFCVTVSSFGGLSQRAELHVSKSTQDSMKNFSGRWRNRYLEEVMKHKGEKKCREIVERPVYSSVYSDFETDSDSVVSWMEPTKQKASKIVQKPKITYEKKGRKMFPNKKKRKQLIVSDVEKENDSVFSQLERRKQKVSKTVKDPKISNENKNRMICSNRQKKGLVLCPKQCKSQSSFPTAEKSIIRPKTRKNKFCKPAAENHISPRKKSCFNHSVRTFATHAVENRHSHFDLFRSKENEGMEETVPVEINILPCLQATGTFDTRHLSSSNTEAEHAAGNKIVAIKDNELLSDYGVKKRNVRITGKSTVIDVPPPKRQVTDKTEEILLQDVFNLGSASSGMAASNSKIPASEGLSSLTCGKKLVYQDQGCSSEEKDEVADDTGNRKIQTGVTSKESMKYVYKPLLGVHRRETDDTKNMYMERTSAHSSDKVMEMHSDCNGTRCNQNVASSFHSSSNVHTNFTAEENNNVAVPLQAAKDICQRSPQNNTGYCSDRSLLASEDDFWDFLKEFSESSEEETNMYDNLDCNSMDVMKHMLEDQKRGRKAVHGNKTDKLVTNASLLLEGTGNCGVKEHEEEEGGMLNGLCSVIEPEQSCISSLPSLALQHANSLNYSSSLSPSGAVSSLSLSVGDRQSLRPQTGSSYYERGEKHLSKTKDLSVSKKDKPPNSSNTGSPYSGRSQKSQGQITESPSSEENEQYVNSPDSERGHKLPGQINLSLSKKSEQLMSSAIGLSYPKRVWKPVSPCARDIVPLSRVCIASLPTEAEASNNSDSGLSQSKKMVQSLRADSTSRELSRQGASHSPQKSMLFSLESAAEDSDKKCVQSTRGVLTHNKKSRYSNKKKMECTIVAKERKKRKQNTSMDLTFDGRTMAMRGLTEANDVGLALAAGGVIQVTENSANFVFTDTTPWTVMNPETIHREHFMTDFIQNSADMIEGSVKQTYLKGSEMRKLLVADYIQKCESEMEKIKSNIEHLNEQEARWQKLENYIRRSFQLQHNCLDEMAECKTCLSNSHHYFNKQWQKLERDQRSLPLVETDLKQQLHELMVKKLEEENKNDVIKLRVRLQAILGFM